MMVGLVELALGLKGVDVRVHALSLLSSSSLLLCFIEIESGRIVRDKTDAFILF